jgi:hypothetical protein
MDIQKVFSKKTQAGIQEMSFMIIALVIFFILVLLFYLAISFSGLKKTVEAGSRDSAILLIARLSGSPEFACADNSIDLCVDTDKIMALMISPAYKTFWNVEGLRIERVYPQENKTVLCEFGNYPNCNTFVLIKNKTSSIIEDTSFVSLCRKEFKNGYNYNECELGKIKVTSKKTV